MKRHALNMVERIPLDYIDGMALKTLEDLAKRRMAGRAAELIAERLEITVISGRHPSPTRSEVTLRSRIYVLTEDEMKELVEQRVTQRATTMAKQALTTATDSL